MRISLSFLFICSVAPGLAGCSGIVASGGRNIRPLLSAHESRQRIEAVLGRPVHEEVYDADSLPSTRTSRGDWVRAARFARYRYVGRADDMEQFQDLGMLVGMTLGLGEVVAFPMSLVRSAHLADSVHEYEVWYDSDDRCVAHEAHHDWGYGG